MEFEGDVVFLTAPQDQIKHLRRVANGKDTEIVALKSALQETTGLLEAAKERISRLLGEKSSAPRIAKAAKLKKKTARRIERYKKPGDPKRTFSPEAMALLRDNMAKARAAKSARAA